MKKTLTADFSKGNEKAYVRGLYQHDYGAILKVTGIEYAEIIRVDFAGPNDEKAHPVLALQESDGGFCVKIPKENTDKDGELSAYIYVTDAEAGFTIKEVILPIIGRVEADPDPSGEKTDPFAEAIEEIKKNAKSASDSAASAAESEKSASKSATQAEKSAAESQESAKAAATSEKAAATSATAAAESERHAGESATTAQTAADQATKSATAAAESATTATQQATNAAQSATNASGSAKSADQSAETAKTAADAAGKSASSAQQASRSAAESASTAIAAAQTATTAAGNAAESVTSAAQSAETAGQKATAAETSANNAAESATEAGKSATAAGDSASVAKTSETAAGEAAQTAQEQADRIEESAEQIEKNKAGVAAVIIEESATGADIVISDSAEMPLKNLKLFGKSEQATTTGKNLFDFSKIKNIGGQGKYDIDYERQTITIPANTNNVGYVDTMRKLCPEATAGKMYVLSCNTSNSEAGRHIYLLKTGRAINFGKAFEWSDEMLDDKIAWYNNAKTNNENVISEIQFEEGTVVTDYEPYTGGKPSPSPDWPQEISSVGDSGNIEVDVVGKNLVNIQDVTVGWAQDIQTSLDDLNKHVGETITVTAIFDVISVLNKVSDQYIFQIYTLNTDNEYRAIAGKNLSIEPKVGDRVVIQKVTKLTKKIQKMLLYAFGNNKIGTLGTSKATVQIELGGVATPYKPFEKETLNLITPNGFRGIPVDSGGNYTDENGQQWICDEVDFERGLYIQRIGIADQDSFSTITWTTGAICFVNLKANTLSTKYAMTTISCTYKPTWVPSSYATHFTQTLSQKLIIVLPQTITTEEQGEKIRQKGFKFAYILGKPIETPLSPEEIAAYKSFTTHKTTTLISNDTGTGMEVTYVADPKTYIDNKFTELSHAIVASASEAE